MSASANPDLQVAPSQECSTYLFETLCNSQIISDKQFESLLNGKTEEQKKQRLMKLLEKPDLAFAKSIQEYCYEKSIEYFGQWYLYVNEAQPYFINMKIQSLRKGQTWRSPFKQLYCNLFQQNGIKSIKYQAKIFDDKNTTANDVLQALKDLTIVQYCIHTNSEFIPDKYPCFDGNGSYKLHIVKYKERLFLINFEKKDREKLDDFYKLKGIYKYKIVLCQADWSEFLNKQIKTNDETIQKQETEEQDRRKIQIKRKKDKKKEKINLLLQKVEQSENQWMQLQRLEQVKKQDNSNSYWRFWINEWENEIVNSWMPLRKIPDRGKFNYIFEDPIDDFKNTGCILFSLLLEIQGYYSIKAQVQGPCDTYFPLTDELKQKLPICLCKCNVIVGMLDVVHQSCQMFQNERKGINLTI